MSQLFNLRAAYSLVETLYGIEPNPNSFEDVALAGWELIGNKHTRLYRFEGSTVNQELELPCNACDIESVTIPIPDAQLTGNKINFWDANSIITETYIDKMPHNNDLFNVQGKLLKYREGDNTLLFSRDYDKVIVIYHGIIADEESGLPMINEKEMHALAAFVAWRELLKEGLKKKNGDSIQLASVVEKEWLKRCNAARIKSHLSQNDMNAILDVKTRWDRKAYGKSYKPIL